MAQMTITSFMTGIKNWVLGKIGAITDLIPSQASSSNKLADKNFVNSSIATATATFRGTYNVVSGLHLHYNSSQTDIAAALNTTISTKDNNDYAFVQIPTSDASYEQIKKIERYKFDGENFAFEYELNNSGFTAAQWATINSGLTSGDKAKLDALPTNAELTTLLAGKQNVLTFDNVPTQNSDNPVKSGGIYSAIATAITNATNIIKEWANGIFAKIDGYYETMVVGTAKNLEGQNVTEGTFFARPTGGESAELANGLAQLLSVKGRSVKYNQIQTALQNPNKQENGVTFTLEDNGLTIVATVASGGVTGNSYIYKETNDLINGHKYFVRGCPKGGSNSTYWVQNAWTGTYGKDTGEGFIFTASSSVTLQYGPSVNLKTGVPQGVYKFKPQLVDLTALGIDNLTTVAEVEAWLAANWGAMDYYPYSEGAVLNVNMTGVESFKKNLLNPTTGKAEIIGAYSEVYGNYYGICGTYGTLTFKDVYGNESTITPDSDGKFELTVAGELTVADAGADCAVFLWWDGTETEYSEYGSDIAKLDIAHIYGKKNGTGELVRVWPTGSCGLGDLQDMLTTEDGAAVAKRVMQEVDMGDLTWTFRENGVFFATDNIGAKKTTGRTCVCTKYESIENVSGADAMVTLTKDKVVALINSTYDRVYVKDSAYDNATTFKNAMASVMLYYELATPETYTDLVYMGSSLFEDGTPVTLPINYEADNWGVEKVLPQNTPSAMLTAMPTIECKYSLDAVEQLDTHTAEIADLYDKNVEMDAKKANKVGEYPDMVVGSAAALKGVTAQSAEFVFRPSGSPDKVAKGIAQIEAVKGKSLVWNQLFANTMSEKSFTDGTIVKNDGKYALTLTSSPETNYVITLNNSTVTEGHKYLWSCSDSRFKIENAWVWGTDVSKYTGSKFINLTGYSGTASLGLLIPQGLATGTYNFYVNLIDLTLMFGAGNEPSTVAEFEKMFPLPYYAYNAGTIINNAATAIEVVGFNQCNEDWVSEPSLNRIKSNSYSSLIGGQTYYAKGNIFRIYLYDSNNEVLSYITSSNLSSNERRFTAPSNAVSFMILTNNGYGTTYLNDICINLSDASKNDTYEPYKKSTVELNIPTLTGKLNGEGESVVICADGLRGVGTAFDEGVVENGYLTKITKRIGQQVVSGAIGDTVTLTGCDTNATTFLCASEIGTLSGGVLTLSAAASNVEVYFPLAEPQVYVLDTPIPVSYQVDGGGTERRLPEDTASEVNAPFAANIRYSIDAVGTLNDLPKNFDSAGGLDDLCSALATALGGALNGTLSIQRGAYNATTQKYAWTVTFTPNA